MKKVKLTKLRINPNSNNVIYEMKSPKDNKNDSEYRTETTLNSSLKVNRLITSVSPSKNYKSPSGSNNIINIFQKKNESKMPVLHTYSNEEKASNKKFLNRSGDKPKMLKLTNESKDFFYSVGYCTPLSPSYEKKLINKLNTATPKSSSISRIPSKGSRQLEKNSKNTQENESKKFPDILNRNSSTNIMTNAIKQNEETRRRNELTNQKIKNLRLVTPVNRNMSPRIEYKNTPSNNSQSQVTTQTNSIANSPKNNYDQIQGQELINVSTLINNQNIPLSLSNLSVYFPFYESTKCSTKAISQIKAYSANTYQGIIRNYNEDRVSVILNIAKPHNYTGNWPHSSFFGIYDGHGGNNCADFLRDHLHSYVIRDVNFPHNPVEALKKGFERAEADFIYTQAMTKNMDIMDKSGSCAVVALVIEDICYVANVGDSRAVLSLNGGKSSIALTNDHKPNEEGENKRIVENGGKVYQTQTPSRLFNMPSILHNSGNPNQVIIGPYRVFPGRLSVSRTFGDVEAKIPKFGGLPGVVVATPEIKHFHIDNDADFLVLGCDGIFDQLSNKDCIDAVWMTMKDDIKSKDFHSQCALGVDMLMKSSLVRRTLDNVTILLIAFTHFENIFNETLKDKTENFSPKSSFYLYNVIENKEHTIGEHCHTDGEFNSQEEEENPQSKNLITIKDVKTTVNNLASNNSSSKLITHGNLFNMSKAKLNKVVNIEVSRKIIMSPKNRKILKLDTDYPNIPQITDQSKVHTVKGKNISLKLADDKQRISLKKLQ